MQANRSRDTKPEMIVRRFLHAQGYRYRVNLSDLPGKPDVVFKARRKIIFVHGCFWHRHRECRLGSSPRSNSEYWAAKLDRNVERDSEHLQTLRGLGWEVKTVWECETRTSEAREALYQGLVQYLGPAR